MRGVGEFSNGLKNHVWYYSVVGWFENADPRYDYAMIILEDQTNTANLGWFGWKSSGHTGSVWNFGYPIWSYACAASPIEITNWCWNYLYGDDGNILNVHWGQLGYRIDTQGGHSGSPVYKYNGGDRRVVAVHAYGGTIRNWGTRIRSAVSGNICDWIGNHPSAFANHGCY
jgi:V8-like Glu-specific endopeptidase